MCLCISQNKLKIELESQTCRETSVLLPTGSNLMEAWTAGGHYLTRYPIQNCMCNQGVWTLILVRITWTACDEERDDVA